MHALIWSLVLVFLACWSLLAWATHAVVTWEGWRAPDLGAWAERAQQIAPPAWTQPWLPQPLVETLKAGLAQWGPWLHETLAQLPDVSGWLGAAVWTLWGAGGALLLALGVLGSVLARKVRSL